jgi:hypothetical protein
MAKSKRGSSLHPRSLASTLIAVLASACGPHAHIPPRPIAVPGQLDSAGADSWTARALAPVLYLQRDEWFPLSRAVAVVHPTRRLIGYHMLWRDDVHGAWIPLTKPTDEEIVWVGYDSTGAPTDVWTFWHGTILHTDWRGRGTVEIDVQWGKHGSLPRGAVLGDLPRLRSLRSFWLGSWIGIPDIALGRISRKGPWCFCEGYRRYRDFRRPLLLGAKLDAVVQLEDPDPALRVIFGTPYSQKLPWPLDLTKAPPIRP